MKRVLDVVLALMALVLLSPLLVITAIFIVADSGLPVLFRQIRVGQGGREFGMYKFRSMVKNAAALGPYFTADIDPRITRVGRFIRRTSIDELPQLLNVLKGDMSLVGPRPELPWLVEKYQPWQRKRFAVPQGITGWWQVNGRSDNLMHLHTDQDLYYIQNYSLWLDLQILWRTLFVVLRGRGAY